MINISSTELETKYKHSRARILYELQRYFLEDKAISKNPELGKQLGNITEDSLEIYEHILTAECGYITFDITAEGHRNDFRRTANLQYTPEEPYLHIICDPTHNPELLAHCISNPLGFNGNGVANDINTEADDDLKRVVYVHAHNYFARLNMYYDYHRVNDVTFYACDGGLEQTELEYCQVKITLKGHDGKPLPIVVGYLIPSKDKYVFIYAEPKLPLAPSRKALKPLNIISLILLPMASILSLPIYIAMRSSAKLLSDFTTYCTLASAISFLTSTIIRKNIKLKVKLKIASILLSFIVIITIIYLSEYTDILTI